MMEYLNTLALWSLYITALFITAGVLLFVYLVVTHFRRRESGKTTPVLFAALALTLITSCTTVDSGHRGVEVSWGGKTNMERIYPEGMHTGLGWVWDDLVEYDVREKTLVEKYTFNDANNMSTGVEVALDYRLNPDQVNLLHTQITDVLVKIQKTLKSAGKEVVPQYSASDLNLRHRGAAEQKMADILSKELPEFYVEFARIQITDVDIPDAIAKTAEATARQLELNKLAGEKEEEARKNYNAAQWDAKTKEILSQPAMLALKKLEIEAMWAQKGVSPWGTNNVFGDVGVIKGLR